MNKQQIALVTGGAGGIGKAIVNILAQKGCFVVFCDKQNDLGKQTEKELIQLGLPVEFVQCDLSQDTQRSALLCAIIDKHQRLDVLVNNARAGKRVPLEQESLQNWDETLNVSLTSPFFLTQSAVRQMYKQGGGVVVNIGSVAASHVGAESPSYHMAKAGIVQMTRYFAAYAGRLGVRTNCVMPGLIIKDEHLQRYLSKENSLYRSTAEQCQPCGYTGRSIDVAHAVAWLCSSESQFMNGSIVYLDGGLTIQDPVEVAFRLKKNDCNV